MERYDERERQRKEVIFIIKYLQAEIQLRNTEKVARIR